MNKVIINKGIEKSNSKNNNNNKIINLIKTIEDKAHGIKRSNTKI